MIRYKNSKLLRIADVLATIIASALLIASILALNFIDRVIIRLVAIALFTMTFSLILTIVTNARRVEIFAATATQIPPKTSFVQKCFTDRRVGKVCFSAGHFCWHYSSQQLTLSVTLGLVKDPLRGTFSVP